MLELWVSSEDALDLQSQIMLVCGFGVLFVLLGNGVRRGRQLSTRSAPVKVFLFIQACVLTLLVFMSVPGFFIFLSKTIPGFGKEPSAILLLVGLIFFALMGIELYWSGLGKLRHVSDTPTSKIRSAAQGYTELKGRVALAEGQPPLIAPLSGAACVWWQYEVKYKSFADKKCSTDSFCLDDGTGQCRVNPEGATIIEHTMREWDGNTFPPHLPPEYDAHADKELCCYVEYLLLPGRRLYALGEFKSQYGQHQLEAPKDGRPFIISGRNETRLIARARFKAILGALLLIVCVVCALLLIVYS